MLDRATALYMKNVVVVFALIAAAMALRGCVAITPASFDRGTSLVVTQRLTEDDWPTRHVDPVKAVMRGLSELENNTDAPESLLNRVSRTVGFFSHRLKYKQLGQGMVCEMPPPENSRSRQILYITNRLSQDSFDEAFTQSQPSPAERNELLRWHFHLQLPTREVPKGLIVHLTSLGDRRFERAVSRNLRERGWAVMHVVPGRIIVPFLHETVGGENRRVVDAAEIAAMMDNYAADYAYAVEGVLEYLRQTQPELDQRPLVMTGYSAGALALPTVAARLDGRVDAAVLVGGGANAAGILVDGSITDVVRVIRNAGDAHILPDLRAMPAAYLEHSKFDPYHTAPYLTGLPVLVLQGTMDRIIPRSYGDLLYERLNRPERWSYPLGHIPLFWILPSQANRIADWIEQSVQH